MTKTFNKAPVFDISKKDPSVVFLHNVRLSYPSLFQASAFPGAARATYSAHVLVPRDSQAAKDVMKYVEKVAKEKWGAKSASTLASIMADKQRTFWRDGAIKGSDEYVGNMFAALSNESRPRVVNVDNTELSEEDGRPYSGCYVNVSFQIWIQDNKFGKGIRARLRGVQFVADGEPFGASRQVADENEFSEIQPAGDVSLESLLG